MAEPRFASLSLEEIDELVLAKDSSSSKSATEVSFRTFLRYCKEKNIVMDISKIDPSVLNDVLAQFYAETRKEDGSLYKKTSMHSLRYGLQRKIKYIRKDVNIIEDSQFKRSNEVFTAQLVHLKKIGLAKIDHKPPLSQHDLALLYTSGVFAINKPSSLQKKVFFEVLFYLCRRGRENLRLLTKDSFKINDGEDGMRYVTLEKDELTKNHRVNDEQQEGGIMLETGGVNCPVASFVLYLNCLNPKLEAFFQWPKSSVPGNGPWYDNMVLGIKTLNTLMKKISEEANFSTIYTNHSIRATAITLLDSAGLEARHIMAVSGHKAESSIRSYSKTSNDIKRKMSDTLSSASSLKKSKVSFNFGSEVYKNLGDDENTTNANVISKHVQENKQSSTFSFQSTQSSISNSDRNTTSSPFFVKGETYFSNCSFNFSTKSD